MNPLQKKCIYATAGLHLLLLVILFIGPGFFRRKPPEDTLPLLKVIPASAIESELTTGAAANKPPTTVQPPQLQPPQPEPVKQTPPAPTPKPPEPVATPPEEPKPEVTKPVEKEAEPKPEVTKPEELPTQVDERSEAPAPRPKPPHKPIEVSLKPVVHNTPKPNRRDTTAEDDARADAEADAKAAREARAAARAKAAAASRILDSVRENLTSDTDVTMPGESSQSAANYGQLVKSIYYRAWILPGSAANADSVATVRVVIARDGTVESAHLVDPSGDEVVDASVQRTLDRVKFIRRFADNAKEDERTYTIKFDLKTKQTL